MPVMIRNRISGCIKIQLPHIPFRCTTSSVFPLKCVVIVIRCILAGLGTVGEDNDTWSKFESPHTKRGNFNTESVPALIWMLRIEHFFSKSIKPHIIFWSCLLLKREQDESSCRFCTEAPYNWRTKKNSTFLLPCICYLFHIHFFFAHPICNTKWTHHGKWQPSPSPTTLKMASLKPACLT
jgi:hypothetical protein